ncbi:MAG: hypothetical protein EZS28_026605 [Streblomastix strix]|uniref:Uncharacterized protein n=1 Tax=Streblomastix strix TaxID=222440 RepID=A0A5J4V4Z7_9EUKA|nr:MAG: hypothetical protein EZS28_026605 [Streblomastix strix]
MASACLLTVGSDIRVWDPRRKSPFLFSSQNHHIKPLSCFSFNQAVEAIVSGGDDNRIIFTDLSNRIISTIENSCPVISLAQTSKGRYLVCNGMNISEREPAKHVIRLFDNKSDKQGQSGTHLKIELKGPQSMITQLAFCLQDKVIICGTQTGELLFYLLTKLGKKLECQSDKAKSNT